MSSQAHHIRRLATALAAGPMEDREALVARAKPLVGDLRKARWLVSLARKLSLEFGEAPRPTVRRIADRIRAHEGFVKAWTAGQGRISIGHVAPQMAPAAGAPRMWKIPEITTLGDLADTLRLHPDDLGWLISRNAEHYRHRWQVKPKSGRFRLIESPKVLLKFAQRQVLRKILHAIPPHEAARGFRPGCSVRDFVEPHTGKALLVRFDLEDFFPSITAARVLQIFLTAGYPETVARALTRLTTHAAPTPVLEEKTLAWPERRRLATPHLPQGAPTSPALANLSAFRLDCRLAGLSNAAGADYTRYADDLLFSGGEDFARQARRFEGAVGAIIIEEGFRPNHHKTRVLRQGQKQHAAGLVLNEKPNIDRREFDRLKAILTNCARHGPASQNRENHPEFAAHLAGKLTWVRFIHPGKEAKLRAIFERIDWG
ncbi:MAG: reverse transcriptase family protein [Verrucomicrobiota bacterium]